MAEDGAEANLRSFKTKGGEFTVRAFPERFQEVAISADERRKSDRKFNIRIKQDDICLLDALAQLRGVTRSTLINEILYEIMWDELMSVEDRDARVLLAWDADQSASYDDMAQPWIYDALEKEFRFLQQSVLSGREPRIDAQYQGESMGERFVEEHCYSPAYLGLRNKLKGLTK